MIFPAAMTSLQMEELCVRITVSKKRDARSLPSNRSLQRSQTQSAQLCFSPQGKLVWGEGALVLGAVKTKYQLLCNSKLQPNRTDMLGTLGFKGLGRCSQFEVQRPESIQTGARQRGFPCLLDHKKETIKLGPNILKMKAFQMGEGAVYFQEECA